MNVLAKSLGVAAALLLSVVSAAAQDHRIAVGMQESGTARWELQAIETLGLDAKHGLAIDVRFLADSRAGQIALQAGAVDVILSDFVWVSIQRHRGNDVAMVPHSLAVGGLMALPQSGIDGIDDLAGKRIAVAGGPADKSWVTLQAFYHRTRGERLSDVVEVRYGPPPLVNELLQGGHVDAALNYWHWNARAEAAGAVEIISVAEMLAAMDVPEQPPLLGWAFTAETAGAKPEALRAFLDASFDAKAALLDDDDVWEKLRPLMGAEADADLFVALRDAYREGIVRAYDPDDTTAAAEAAYKLLAEQGGSELVGDSEALAAGTFWRGYRRQ